MMSHLLTRRSFSAGLALSLPAAMLGVVAAQQDTSRPLVPAGTGTDLESVFLRISPHDLRDMLLATPFEAMGSQFDVQRWADISRTPYFSSVGGVTVMQAGGSDGDVLGAYGVYLAPAGARAGQYLGRLALEDTTTETVMQEVGGFEAEILVYEDGDVRELTQVPVGNVMVLGYDVAADGDTGDNKHPSAANAELLISHLRGVFQATR